MYALILNLLFCFSAETVFYQSYSRDRVEKKAEDLQGNSNYKIVEESKSIEIQGVFVGPYSTNSLAQKDATYLKQKKIPVKRIRNIKGRDYIYLGSYSKKSSIEKIKNFIQRLIDRGDISGSVRLGKRQTRSVTLFRLMQVPKEGQYQETKLVDESVEDDSDSEFIWLNKGKLLIEYGPHTEFSGYSSLVDARHTVQMIPNEWLEVKVGPRVRYNLESTEEDSSIEKEQILFDETYVALKFTSWQLSLGSQYINWGRVFEGSPIDRMGKIDFSRFIIGEYEQRKLPQGAARFEYFGSSWRLDLAYIPDYEINEIAEPGSPWYPVRASEGYILGAERDPNLILPLSLGLLNNRKDTDPGYGARFSTDAFPFDLGLSYIKAPIFAFLGLSENIIGEIYGIDIGTSIGKGLWRFEFSYTTKSLVPLSNGTFPQRGIYEYATSYEFYPGDTDVQVNLQLSGSIADLESGEETENDRHFLVGQIMDLWWNGKVEPKFKFQIGLDRSDIYMNPELRFLNYQPHIFYLAYHHFSGEESSFAGFYDDNDMLSLGYQFSW
tara:strand:+ start:1696 stop:3348 length:1653 start_codon:yes stop_codon:yes gene_type:complete